MGSEKGHFPLGELSDNELLLKPAVLQYKNVIIYLSFCTPLL